MVAGAQLAWGDRSGGASNAAHLPVDLSAVLPPSFLRQAWEGSPLEVMSAQVKMGRLPHKRWASCRKEKEFPPVQLPQER